MTEIERVWERLKERAVRHADSQAVPSIEEARTIVISICAGECRERPPADAIEFFAAEFMRLTIEAYERETLPHDGERTASHDGERIASYDGERIASHDRERSLG